MLKHQTIPIILICAIANMGNANEQEDFDEICRIYTETKNSSMDFQTASDYILDNVSKRIKSKNTLLTHEAVMEVMQDQRYIVFKDIAQHALKKSWDCEAMKALMGLKDKE